MKICFIGWGNSIHLFRWIDWFANNGHDIVLISRKYPKQKYHKNVKIYDISPNIPHMRQVHDRTFEGEDITLEKITALPLFKEKLDFVNKILKKEKPDILHSHLSLYPGYLGAFTNFKPFVFTAWNGDITWSPFNSKVHKTLTKKILNQADFVTGDSKEVLDGCIKLGCEKTKLHNIQWGIDSREFYIDKNKSELKKLYKCGDKKVFILSRGIMPYHNQDLFFKSLLLLSDKYLSKIKVVMFYGGIGDQKYLEEILKLLNNTRIKDIVINLGGPLSHKIVSEIFRMGDFYISIGTNDSTPVTLLEAMASGLIPILSNILSYREWCQDNKNALFVDNLTEFDLCEVIKKTLDLSEEKLKIIKKNNSECVKQRADYYKNMKNVEELYYKILNY